jgi:hypothetical protein
MVKPTATLGFDGDTVTVIGPFELPLPHPDNPTKATITAAIAAKSFELIRISDLHFTGWIFIFCLKTYSFPNRQTVVNPECGVLRRNYMACAMQDSSRRRK